MIAISTPAKGTANMLTNYILIILTLLTLAVTTGSYYALYILGPVFRSIGYQKQVSADHYIRKGRLTMAKQSPVTTTSGLTPEQIADLLASVESLKQQNAALVQQVTTKKPAGIFDGYSPSDPMGAKIAAGQSKSHPDKIVAFYNVKPSVPVFDGTSWYLGNRAMSEAAITFFASVGMDLRQAETECKQQIAAKRAALTAIA